METCRPYESLKIIVNSFFGFTLLNYFSSSLTKSLTNFYNELDEGKKAIWDNTLVSYVHASICSVLAPVCFYLYPEVWKNLIYTNIPIFAFQIALSTGYFVYDMSDFVVKKIFMDTVGIWIHHIMIVIIFSSSLYTCVCTEYLTASLIVEISNVFLHQRKLYLTCFKTKTTRFYRFNSLLLFLTMTGIRIPAHVYLSLKVWREYELFHNRLYWSMAFYGLITINILNTQLWLQLWNSDWKKTFLGGGVDAVSSSNVNKENVKSEIKINGKQE
ncbi:13124_t:CDS:2 [Ambispora gerdemannii]|uniref:13124_t:CDS:1 n=1 Tax=Ambispora gerdemannii TaxID=144530 RepID=A0A9N9FJK2_9GLOM|nr:13124_t:CDS:2 [Ambispora gerdemannii]